MPKEGAFFIVLRSVENRNDYDYESIVFYCSLNLMEMSQSNLNRKRSRTNEGGDVQERPTKCRNISSYFGGGRRNSVGQSKEGTSSEEPVQSQPTQESIQQIGEPNKSGDGVAEPDISNEDDLEEEYPVNNQYQDESIDFGDDDGAINSNTKGRGKSKEKTDRQWEMARRFKFDWAEKYPFIEPVDNPIVGEPPVECRCTICSWKYKREKRLQLKLDTIEKHVGKIYETSTVDGKEIKVVRYKTKEQCQHKRNAEEYYMFQKFQTKPGEVQGSINAIFAKASEVEERGKVVQLSNVFHILSRGRPMTDYPEMSGLLHFLKVPNYPVSHWSINSGWEWASCIAQVEIEDVQRKIKESTFIALSLDEVTAIDNTSWVCMHVYTVQNNVCQPHLLSVAKLRDNATAETLFQLVKSNLIEYGAMDELTIAKKLVCVGADGASVMQGQRNGLCTKMQASCSPYVVGIHCMAHRMNLAFRVVKKFPSVNKVEDLVRELYAYFCRSPKRFREFQHFADGITDGNKLLKDVDTRWISLDGPSHRVFSEYQSLIGLMYENQDNAENQRCGDLLRRLSNIETLLTLASLLPMLEEMRLIMKKAQQRAMYIAEYAQLRKMSCRALDSLYRTDLNLSDDRFNHWRKLTDLDDPDNYLKIVESGDLCVCVRGFQIPMYYSAPKKRATRVTREEFTKIVESIASTARDIAYRVSSEIISRFPYDQLLEAMAIVFPQYWSFNNKEDYRRRLLILIKEFCKSIEFNGVTINGILDEGLLRQQSGTFARTMKHQYQLMRNPHEEGSATKLWTELKQSTLLSEEISEYFKLADLCQTMILGSVEDERVFSALGFLKSKLRNKLDKNLESCLRVYTSRYDVNTFPYQKAMEIWKKRCKRRGVGNTINQSPTATPSGTSTVGSGTGHGIGSHRSRGQSELEVEEDTNENEENNEATGLPELDDDDDIEMNWKI